MTGECRITHEPIVVSEDHRHCDECGVSMTREVYDRVFGSRRRQVPASEQNWHTSIGWSAEDRRRAWGMTDEPH